MYLVLFTRFLFVCGCILVLSRGLVKGEMYAIGIEFYHLGYHEVLFICFWVEKLKMMKVLEKVCFPRLGLNLFQSAVGFTVVEIIEDGDISFAMVLWFIYDPMKSAFCRYKLYRITYEQALAAPGRKSFHS